MTASRNTSLIISKWSTCELSFASSVRYKNTLYDAEFYAVFTSPSQKQTKVNGFWDGDDRWKIRFMLSETGIWAYETFCSDTHNEGLHERKGTFKCKANQSPLAIYQKGPIVRLRDAYHLSYTNGDPFFWAACTAWSGALKSTQPEWEYYLQDRATHHFSVIQFVATQWRGCDMDSCLQVAYTGNKHIQINPAFFQRMDEKIAQINAHGLVAAPVLLWALPYGKGRSLSPGVQLSQEDAIRLARYMVARYGGHHVIWILGGDGLYTTIHESRWKNIGKGVFGEAVGVSHVVAMHSMGKSWIGDTYAEEGWLDIVGYQSGHHADRSTFEFITKGPAASQWQKLPPSVYINMEPCYEEINHQIYADAVRRASYRSLLATPLAGISYGANGIWPWIRPGEKIMNHGSLADRPPTYWKDSLALPGSRQVSYLAAFIRQLPWASLRPDQSLLSEQAADEAPESFISIVRSEDYHLLVAYVPAGAEAKIHNTARLAYQVQWFDPVAGTYDTMPEMTLKDTLILNFVAPAQADKVLVLRGV